MQESKEKISNRMIKNASKIWGYQDTQAESSFDPLIGIILGALASELAKISNEINSVESRVLERLIELLTPEPVTGPFPAHSIFRAMPAEPVFTINSLYQFYINKKIISEDKTTDIEKPVFFTPAGKYKLFNGQVKYFAAGTKFFQFQKEFYKEIIALARANKSLKATEIWLGLELNKNVNSLEGLSFCFDLRNEAYDKSFYSSLSKGKWFINGNKIDVKQGFYDYDSDNTDSLDSLLQKEIDITTKITDHINRFYKNKFQTVTGDHTNISELYKNNSLPKDFTEIFPQKHLEKIEEDILWIKIEFPQIIPVNVFDDVLCSINCFPVFNRHLNEFTQSSREFINIIPLITDEFFLDMKRVTSSSGKLYSEKSFSGVNDIDNGTYIVRHGGVGRFDSRNAAEIVNYLLELLRDESAAFSIIGADMITSDLKELNQNISRLEQRLEQSNIVKKEISYLLLKSHPEDDTLFVEYWTTNGNFANRIKGKPFIYDGSDLIPDSVSIINRTIGGREGMDAEERVNAYRKALLSHGRIVTKEDIKALCHEHFGELLKSVEIKKGLKTGEDTNSGFIQTLDIFITLKKSCDELEKEEVQFLKKDLLVKLDEQSTNILPFRCFVNGKE